MSRTKIWMPLYVADYLADTTRLSTEQHGAYLLLIMDYWRNGPLPDDDQALVNITRLSSERWAKHRAMLAGFFTIEDGFWRHHRIDQELAGAAKNQAQRSVSGRVGASSKWGSSEERGKANRAERLANARRLATHSPAEWQALVEVCGSSCLSCGTTENLVKDHILPIYQGGSDGVENLQPLCRSCNSAKGPDSTDRRPFGWREALAKRLANAWQTPAPSPSPSPSEMKESHTPPTGLLPGVEPALEGPVDVGVKGIAYPEPFEAFWSLYPRKEGKKAAFRAWQVAKKLVEQPVLLGAVQRYAKACQGKDPRYVAQPTTWLNQGRWDDQPAGPAQATPGYVPMAANGG